MCSQSHYVINVTKSGLFSKMLRIMKGRERKILNVDYFVRKRLFILHILVKSPSLPIERM